MGLRNCMKGGYFALKMQFFCLFVTSAYTHTHTHRCLQMHTCTHHPSHILFFCIHVITQNTVLHKFTQFLSHTIPVTALRVCIHTIIHTVLHKLSLTTTTQNIYSHTPHYPPALWDTYQESGSVAAERWAWESLQDVLCSRHSSNPGGSSPGQKDL